MSYGKVRNAAEGRFIGSGNAWLDGQERKVRGWQLTCSLCQTQSKFVGNHRGSSLPPHMLSRKFEQQGWFVGHKDVYDLCPDCYRKPRSRYTDVRNELLSKAEAVFDKPAVEQPTEPMPEPTVPEREPEAFTATILNGKVAPAPVDLLNGIDHLIANLDPEDELARWKVDKQRRELVFARLNVLIGRMESLRRAAPTEKPVSLPDPAGKQGALNRALIAKIRKQIEG